MARERDREDSEFIDKLVHINRVALLSCDELRIDFQFMHESRMRAAKHEKIDPVQPDCFQLRTNVPSPHVVTR